MSREPIYTLEDTARALQVSPKTIIRRIEAGELRAVRRGRIWWISQQSLREWIFRALAIVRRQSGYRRSRKICVKSERFRGQVDCPSRYISRESSCPAVIRGKVSHPHEAVVELQGSFRHFARRYVPKNYALQDDLVQEMSLAVLQCEAPANRTFFLNRAKSRAIDYLAYEQSRGMSDLQGVPHPVAPEPIRNEDLLRVLKMAGIPVELIARELHIAISPDVELEDC